MPDEKIPDPEATRNGKIRKTVIPGGIPGIGWGFRRLQEKSLRFPYFSAIHRGRMYWEG